MSIKAVAEFYARLYEDKELFAKGVSLQEKYSDQEELMQAFIELGRSCGYHFSLQDLLDHVYRNGEEVSSSSGQ